MEHALWWCSRFQWSCVLTPTMSIYLYQQILDPSLLWELNYQLRWVNLRISERWTVTECEVQVIKHTENTVLYSLSSRFNAYKAVCNISIDETKQSMIAMICSAGPSLQ